MGNGIKEKTYIVVDAEMGMAGDMFSSALISLGVPGLIILEAMKTAAKRLGDIRIELREEGVKETDKLRVSLYGLDVSPLRINEHLDEDTAKGYLEEALNDVGVTGEYGEFAKRTLDVLIEAEREAHDSLITLRPIGVAHTPFKGSGETPYQALENEDFCFENRCYIELLSEFSGGLLGIESFSHIFVISYLNRAHGYSLRVVPPWQRGDNVKEVGLFASRSPSRPNPLGLTLTKLRYVKGNRLYTGALDLFDGTPVVDIKPQIRSIDGEWTGNNGWLENTEHLELHKRGIPHVHDESAGEVILHEAQDILVDIVGAAVGLEYLRVDMRRVIGLSPISFGGGHITFSHGRLPVPPPAVMAILRTYRIPSISGPVDVELLTPTGASIVSALVPTWQARELFYREFESSKEEIDFRVGYGMGSRKTSRFNALKLILIPS